MFGLVRSKLIKKNTPVLECLGWFLAQVTFVLNSYGIIGSGQRWVSKWVDRCTQEIIGGG